MMPRATALAMMMPLPPPDQKKGSGVFFRGAVSSGHVTSGSVFREGGKDSRPLFAVLAVMMLLLLPVSLPAAADPTPARRAELMNLLKQDCGSCHGMTLQGGLGPALTPDRMSAYPVEALTGVILDGRHGTPMPPWRGILKDDEATWLAVQLRKGVTR